MCIPIESSSQTVVVSTAKIKKCNIDKKNNDKIKNNSTKKMLFDLHCLLRILFGKQAMHTVKTTNITHRTPQVTGNHMDMSYK